MRNKGDVAIGFIVVTAIVSSMLTLGFYKTQQNGVLKNNCKKIFCKMQNKGEAYCNEQYPDKE